MERTTFAQKAGCPVHARESPTDEAAERDQPPFGSGNGWYFSRYFSRAAEAGRILVTLRPRDTLPGVAEGIYSPR